METIKLQTKIWNEKGQTNGQVDLPAEFFGVKWNDNFMHQIITSMMSNIRPNIADTKGRGEVSGGGRKPWRQKGTGQARHGSIRSPIWVGGGVTHGPTSDRNYKKKINKKAMIKALFSVLSAKLRDGEIVMLEDLAMSAPKAKQAQTILDNLAKGGLAKINYQKGKRAVIAIPALDQNIKQSFRNIASATVIETRNLDPLTLLNYKYIVFVRPEDTMKQLAIRLK